MKIDPVNPNVSYCGYANSPCTTGLDCDYGQSLRRLEIRNNAKIHDSRQDPVDRTASVLDSSAMRARMEAPTAKLSSSAERTRRAEVPEGSSFSSRRRYTALTEMSRRQQ